MPYDCRESEDDFLGWKVMWKCPSCNWESNDKVKIRNHKGYHDLATRSATEAEAKDTVSLTDAQRRLDTIKSARNYITTGFGELRRELSYLPNSAPDLAPDNAVEWHAALNMLENVLAVAASAWQTADHHLGVTLHNLATDTEAINS